MKVCQLLKDSGLRCTPAREAVFRLLCRAKQPLTHGEIAQKPAMVDLDRVTLYRTLTVLCEAGLIHRVRGNKGAWHFSVHPRNVDRCPGNHPHFLCIRCDKMQCLSEQSLQWVAVPEGVEVIEKQLVVRGLCAVCTAV